MSDTPTEAELLQVWDRGSVRDLWTRMLEKQPLYAQEQLDQLPTSLQALAANATLTRVLVGQRWFVIRDAYEAGASWEEIATALGVTVNETIAYYRQAIAAQEEYCAKWHDTARGRAPLADAEGGTGPVSEEDDRTATDDAGKDTGGKLLAGESTQPGESTRADEDGGREREPLRWTKGVTTLGDDSDSPVLVHCVTESGDPADLVMGGRDHRAALASLLDIQWVDVHRPCGTHGCGALEDLDPSDPALFGWVRLQVASVDDAPRWWCSSMCAWSALARAGEELAADERASEYELGGGL